MEDFLGGVSMIPLRGNRPPRPSPRHDGGLLSALSSYLMTPYGSSSEALVPEATDSDVENTLCTIDCITSCRLDELYGQIMYVRVSALSTRCLTDTLSRQLDLEALIAAVRALEALAHDRTVTKLKQGSDDIVSSTSGSYSLPYDPASVFLLETMVSIACHVVDHIEDLWCVICQLDQLPF